MPRWTPRPRPWIEPHLGQARFGGSVHVFLNDRRDVARGERVEIQLGFDRDADRIIGHDQSAGAVLNQSTVAVGEQSAGAVMNQSTVAVAEQSAGAVMNQLTVVVAEQSAGAVTYSRRGSRATPATSPQQLPATSNQPLSSRQETRERSAVYSAVTTVLMPPRTEKSPTTVMRRGCSAATRSSRIWLVTCS